MIELILIFIITWLISGGIIIYHYNRKEYQLEYSKSDSLKTAIFWCWWGCFIPVINIFKRYYEWKGSRR